MGAEDQGYGGQGHQPFIAMHGLGDAMDTGQEQESGKAKTNFGRNAKKLLLARTPIIPRVAGFKNGGEPIEKEISRWRGEPNRVEDVFRR